jgi:RNA polymerase sigma-70 factor (ECF subfamily)
VDVTNPTEGLERGELRRRIDEALGKLTEAHRTVVVMHEFEGLQYKEIADRIGVSIGTVMSRLFYARRRLATLLHTLRRERSE